MMASVNGSRTRTVMPWPSAESISTVPPSAVMFFFTTSMPTPRPETSVTCSAVEKPGAKIRPQTSASLIVSGASMPRSRAFFSSLPRFRPRPSSRTSMTMLPPWWLAISVIVPCSGLPLARRSCGSSMPWSQLLRTRCVSGSVIFSTSPLSSSVASPCVTSSTFLPSLPARSRSMRGKRLNTSDIGIIRIDITASCRSRVLRSRSARPEASCWYRPASTALPVCASIACVITSSPTRLISWSTFSTETRSVLDSGGEAGLSALAAVARGAEAGAAPVADCADCADCQSR